MIYDYIDSFAPFASQMGFDNSGLQIGSRDKEVTRVMVALDASAAAAEQAVAQGCQLLVTHHPYIFHPARSIPASGSVYRLTAAGVDVISAHTNLDIADGGVNECLVRSLGFTGFERLEKMPYCMTGELPREMSAAGLARIVAEHLELDSVQLADSGRPVRRVAVICGSGGDEVYDLMGTVDALITGEAGHHEMLDARDRGMSVIVAGHFHTERVMVEPLARRLAAQFPEVEFICAKEVNPVVVIGRK